MASMSIDKKIQEGQWTSGFWDCWEDNSNCLLTCFCPCVVFGQIAEIVDRGSTPRAVAGVLYCALGLTRCSWLYGSLYRSRLRSLFSLPEAPYSDGILHSCCCVCSLSQEYRELKYRGLDPSIGWEGNVEKWKRDGLTPPITSQAMSR